MSGQVNKVFQLAGAVVIALVLAGCGGAGSDQDAASTGGELTSVEVKISDGASVDAEQDGGDELTGVIFADPTRAICTTGERIGVIPQEVDTAAVEAWTNATEEPVVFVYPDSVEGDTSSLGTCSVGYEEDEFDDTLLHGQHTHEGHTK